MDKFREWVIGTIMFVFLVAVVSMIWEGMEESPIGQSEEGNKTIQEGKKATSILFEGWGLIGSITTLLTIITALIIYIHKEYNGY